jgi:hypothetical protein
VRAVAESVAQGEYPREFEAIGPRSGRRALTPPVFGASCSCTGRSFDVPLEYGQRPCLHDPEHGDLGVDASEPSGADGFIAADDETCAAASRLDSGARAALRPGDPEFGERTLQVIPGVEGDERSQAVVDRVD